MVYLLFYGPIKIDENAEYSGFYYCCEPDFEDCDNYDAWAPVSLSDVQLVKTINLVPV